MSANVASDALVTPRAPSAVPEDHARSKKSYVGFCLRVIWKTGVFIWKYLVGMLLCQQFLSSILIVGWSYRLMQRASLKKWWKRSPMKREGVGFAEFLGQSETFAEQRYWPNWVLGQHVPHRLHATRSRVRRLARASFGSLWANFKVGSQGIFNTWVLTLPACVLWLFAWYAGWNNSFNKGYEQAWVGPLTGWLGIALFIAAMFYVPMAQARQAATGSYRAFYQFRFIWQLVKGRWLGCLLLAMLYSLLSLLVSILKTAPAFFPQWNPALEDATDAEVLQILNTYYFWCGAAVFACFVVLKLAAARTYAASLLSAVKRGSIECDQLHPTESTALHELGLLRAPEIRPRHFLVHTVTGTGRLVRGAIIGLATFVVWFSFVAQIFVAEFFNYHPVDTARGNFLGGWMNQPLVQAPWFNYTPSSLKERVRTGKETGLSADREVDIP